MLDAIEEAQNNDVLLFSVRYTGAKDGKLNARNKYGVSVMERISLETGGADFDARAMLATALRRSAREPERVVAASAVVPLRA